MDKAAKLPRFATSKTLLASLEDGGTLKIHFKREYEEKECVKLVVASEELRRAVEVGESVCFKGTIGKSDAVICTAMKTFSLKRVETTNTVLFVPSKPFHTNEEYEVAAKASHYYEMTQLNPTFDALIELLKESEYRGYEAETQFSSSALLLYTEKDLENMILCSEDELRRMLKAVGAINIDGYVRLCSPQALHALNRELINTIIEKDWDVNVISRAVCIAEIPGIDIVLLDHALACLGKKNFDGQTWTLSHINLARAVAHLIFIRSEEGNVICRIFFIIQ